jgi:hypothetical protein
MPNTAAQGTPGVKPADIPQHIAIGAARATLHAMQRYFADPAVMVDYNKWLKEQKRKKRSDFNESDQT